MSKNNHLSASTCFWRLLSFICILAFASCGKKESNTELKYEKLKYVNILSDVFLADADIDLRDPYLQDSLKKMHLDFIYKRHNTNETEIKLMLKELESKPELYAEIMSEVVGKISEFRYKNQAEIEKEKSETSGN
jgi:hypothetical protein